MHTMGLYHPFSDIAVRPPYIFDKYSTNNVMDYSPSGDKPRPYTWKWQWDIIRKETAPE